MEPESGPMQALFPSGFVGEQLPEERGLGQSMPDHGHRGAVGFEEVADPGAGVAVELQGEDLVGNDAATGALSERDRPVEDFVRAAVTGEFLGGEQPDCGALATGDLQGDEDVGDQQGVIEEQPADIGCRGAGSAGGEKEAGILLEKGGCLMAESVGDGAGTAVLEGIYLTAGTVEVAVVEETLKAP